MWTNQLLALHSEVMQRAVSLKRKQINHSPDFCSTKPSQMWHWGMRPCLAKSENRGFDSKEAGKEAGHSTRLLRLSGCRLRTEPRPEFAVLVEVGAPV